MTPIRLERREPARNRQRFYAITVTRTLFDGWALVQGKRSISYGINVTLESR